MELTVVVVHAGVQRGQADGAFEELFGLRRSARLREGNGTRSVKAQADVVATYNTYIASQHRPVGDMSTNVVGFGLEGRAMEPLRLRPLLQSYKNVAESVEDSLQAESGIN